jgi:membrane protease YdiL (CAAX protease family)
MNSFRQRVTTFLFLSMILIYAIINVALSFRLPIPIDEIQYLYVVLLYAFLAIFIGREVKNIDEFHLDRTSLILIIFFGIFRSRLNIQNEIYYRILLFLFSLALLVISYKNWKQLPKTRFRWVWIGLIFCVLLVPITWAESLQPENYSSLNFPPGDLGLVILRRILYNLSFVVLLEEIVFRGILWGYLRRFGWTENGAFWGQAILFWLLHLWQIVNPITFFITIPLGTIAYSILVRYSKQILPSIILHTILNTVGPFIVYFYLH